MNWRTKEYLKKRKAQRKMQHPTDLITFLKAELDTSDSRMTKNHIRKTMEELQKMTLVAENS